MADNLTTSNIKTAGSLGDLSAAEITNDTKVICANGNTLKTYPIKAMGGGGSAGVIPTGAPVQKKAGSIWIEDTVNAKQILRSVNTGGALRQSAGYKRESQPVFFAGSLYLPMADGTCRKIDADNNVTVYDNIISVQTDGNYIYLIGNCVENTHIMSEDGAEIEHGYTAEQVEALDSILALDFVRDIKVNYQNDSEPLDVCAVLLTDATNGGAIVYQFYIDDTTGKWKADRIGASETYDSTNDSYKNIIIVSGGEISVQEPSTELFGNTDQTIIFEYFELESDHFIYVIITDKYFFIYSDYVQYRFNRYGAEDFGDIKYLYKINNNEYLALHDNNQKITAVKYTIDLQSILDAIANNGANAGDKSKWITPVITADLLDGGQTETAESLAVLYDDDRNEVYIESDNNALFVRNDTKSIIKVNTLENEKTILTKINVGTGLVYDAETNTINIDKDALKALLA